MKNILNFLKSEKFIKSIAKIGEYLILLALIGLLLTFILSKFTGTPKSFKDKLANIDSLSKKINEISENQKFQLERQFELEKEQIIINGKIDSTLEQIKLNNNKIDKLRRLYNERINNANNFTPNQLDSFFRSRYKEFY